MRLHGLRFRIRSLMLTVLLVAVITAGGVLSWRSAQFSRRSLYFRAEAARYAKSESESVEAVTRVRDLERAVAHAEPPSARADGGAWKAYRGYLSKLRGELETVNASVDRYEGYAVLRRRCERLATTYAKASKAPWLSVEAEAPAF